DMGQRAQPALLAVLDAGQQLASQGLGILEAGISRLHPFFDGLVAAGGNVVRIFQEGAQVVGPFVQVLGTLAGLGVITVLNALGSSLSAVTGFLARNEVIVRALAV